MDRKELARERIRGCVSLAEWMAHMGVPRQEKAGLAQK